MLASASSICDVPSQSRPLSSGVASAAGRTTRRSATQGATGNDSPDVGSVLAPVGGTLSGSGDGSAPSYPSSSPSSATIAAHTSSSVGCGGAA